MNQKGEKFRKTNISESPGLIAKTSVHARIRATEERTAGTGRF
jgi:hypothetical protein